VSPTVDPDQLAALQALRRGFSVGQVLVLEVLGREPGRDPAPVQATQWRSAVAAGNSVHAGRPIGAPGWGADVNRR
jgi:hypothetical protein